MADAAKFRMGLSYKTPQATDDSATEYEDMLGFISLADLLANDLGGEATEFYGINQADPRVQSNTAVSALGAELTVDTTTGEIVYNPLVAGPAIQSLAAGEFAIDTFTYTIRLANGVLSTATVEIVVWGMNDAVTIVTADTDASGSVVEDSADTADTNDTNQAGGSIAFTDTDLSDSHTASFAADASNTTALGTFVLGSVNEAAGAAGGTVDWTYTIDEEAAQYLGAGESVQETFVVTIDDGNGSTVTQNVVVTITGTNDAVTITSGDQSGSVVEDSADTADATDSNQAGGSIVFTDVDLSDAHTASFAADASNTTALGTFVLGSVSEAEGAAGGSVSWTYAIDEEAAQYLGAGESVQETYVVTIDDGNGSTVTQNVVVTITGTNDAPTVPIDSDSAANTLAEDAAIGASAGITASSTDVDGDAVTYFFKDGSGNAVQTLGSFTVDSTTGVVTLAAALDYETAASHELTIFASDGVEESSQTFTVDVTNVNEGPSAANDTIVMNSYLTTTTMPPSAASTPVLAESSSNDSFATATVIDRSSLRVASNPALTDSSDPSVSIDGRITSTADQDVYAIELLAGETLILDVDYARVSNAWGASSANNLDSYLFLYNSAGGLITYNDDFSTGAGGTGSAHTQDSYLTFTASTSGTYYILLKDYDGSGQSSYGDYVLQVSIDNYSGTATDERPVTFSADALLANDSDEDGDSLSVVSVSGTGVSLADGMITVAPGVTSFSYTISDGNGGTSTATVNVTQTDGDTLTGTSGSDVLAGSDEADTLAGGGGADILSGGQGADTFAYSSTGDSDSDAMDQILDFVVGSDSIDLSAVDADPSTLADDPFTFIGTAAFSNVAGELRLEVQDGNTIVSMDVDGDGIADMQITLIGDQSALLGSDFLL